MRFTPNTKTLFISMILSTTCWAAEPPAASPAAPAGQPASCANIRVRGMNVQDNINRIRSRARTLCGEDGKSGQVSQLAGRVRQQLDACKMEGTEFSTPLTSAFDNNQGKRAEEICKNLSEDLKKVEAFCKDQASTRSTSAAVIRYTNAENVPMGQYQLHNNMVNSHRFANEGAKAFQQKVEKLLKDLETRRRQGKQSRENAAHSEDELMRRQETFFLEMPRKRAQQFTQLAQAEKDAAKKTALTNAARACTVAGQANGSVVQFRQQMENNVLPNQENIYSMVRQIDEQAKADIVQTQNQLTEAEKTRDRFGSAETQTPVLSAAPPPPPPGNPSPQVIREANPTQLPPIIVPLRRAN